MRGKHSLLNTVFESHRPDYLVSAISCYESSWSFEGTECLLQKYEVLHSYLQGNEILAIAFDSFYAKGAAHALLQHYGIEQFYVLGRETWSNTYASDYARGAATGLIQSLDILQVYVQGSESWAFRYEFVDGMFRFATVAIEYYQTLQREFQWSACNCFSIQLVNQVDTISSFDSTLAYEVLSGVVLAARFDVLNYKIGQVTARLDIACQEMVDSAVFSWEQRFDRFCLQSLETTEIVLDTFSGQVRLVDYAASFEEKGCSQAIMCSLLDCPENASLVLANDYEKIKISEHIVRLQEEALYEYSATLIDVLTGTEITNVSSDPFDSLTPLRESCFGKTLWQIEMATVVRYYDPARIATFKEPIRWRFTTQAEKHWKKEPKITDLSVEPLESFFQLHFTASWPYESIRSTVETFQLEPTEEEDFFDLGVWVSGSLHIDIESQPVLTLPYTCDIRDYAVHVPRSESIRYIAVAPIRRFPYEQIGPIAEIAIPQ